MQTQDSDSVSEEKNSAMISSHNNIKDAETWLKVRYIQAVLLFFCFFTAYFLRVNLSIAIVAMTDHNSTRHDSEKYNWNEKTKSLILSSFFFGYFVIQVPAGQLGQLVSPKLLLITANLICAILSALIPVAARTGWIYICIIRFSQGLCQGFYTPLSYNLASKWAPPNERNRFVGFSLNGVSLGTTAVLPLSGILASSSWGWPSIFYVSGILGLLWCGMFAYLGADNPMVHPSISQHERTYIQHSLHETSLLKLKTPWKSILTSLPVWSLICAHVGNGWNMAIILTELPSYTSSVLKFNISANGFLSALPYLSMWLFSFPVCWLADFVNKHNLLTPGMTRKLWTTISQSGVSVMLMMVGFAGYNALIAITLFTLALSLSTFLFSGYNINHLDLSPNYSGVLMGIGNSFENIGSTLAPLSIGWIISDNRSVEQWRWVFAMAATITLIGNILFVLFGTADIQPWNMPSRTNINTKNNRKNPIMSVPQ